MALNKMWFKIEMVRGDISDQTFTVDSDDTVTDLDEIYFTVKKHYYENAFLFQKRLSEGSIVVVDPTYNKYGFRIQPEDTNKLPFGEYVCDIEIKKEGELLKTFNGKLTLYEEVTTARNEL